MLPLVLLLTSLAPCSAEIINIGTITFDTVIPGGVTPGTNGFTIANLTGPFALPPDFPVMTAVLLDATVTIFFENGGMSIFTLGTLAPDFHTPTELQFPDTEGFLSATLTADLSPLQLALSDGRLLNILDPHIQVQLIPSIGSTLTAGVDFAVISVDADAAQAVPEPGTLGMMADTTVLLLWLTHRKKPS